MNRLFLKFISSYVNATAGLFPAYNGNLIFKLVCNVKNPPLKPKTKAFFETGSITMIPTTHKDVALHQWGSGPKNLLFLHGWRSNAKQWKAYVDQLDLTEYTIYALDAPGHGSSPGTHLNLELYRYAIEQTVTHIGNVHCVICHSLGSLAISYAYLYNKDLSVSAYIIMGSPGSMQDILDYSRDMLSLSRKAIHNLRNKIDTIIKIPLETVTLEQFFMKVDKPTLVIHENSDNITPASLIKQALEGKSHIQSLYTKGQDHMLKGQETIDRITTFIKNN